jgi:hypothetical protein
MVQKNRPQMTIWRMRFACWVPKATDTHSEYVILIGFPQQRWLSEVASLLRLYVNYIVSLIIIEDVYSAVRTESLYAIQIHLHNIVLPSDVSIGFRPISVTPLGALAELPKRTIMSEFFCQLMHYLLDT